MYVRSCVQLSKLAGGKQSDKMIKQPYDFIKTTEDALVQTIAERIVDYARVCMMKKNRVSPFERAAAREGMWFRGGVSCLESWCGRHADLGVFSL